MLKMNRLLRDILIFAFMAPVGLFGWHNNSLVTFVLAAEFLLAAAFLYEKKETAYFMFVGLFGTGLEIIGSSLGMWTYANPNLVTVPAWIFFSWGLTFMLFHSVYLEFEKHLNSGK